MTVDIEIRTPRQRILDGQKLEPSESPCGLRMCYENQALDEKIGSEYANYRVWNVRGCEDRGLDYKTQEFVSIFRVIFDDATAEPMVV